MLQQVDRFVVEQTLGAGAMGTVYRAHDATRGATVALKVLHGADPTALLRFKTEFRALANLVHRNLVQLYELVTSGEQYLLSMELVEGGDFLTYVRSKGRFSPAAPHGGVTESVPPPGASFRPGSQTASNRAPDPTKLMGGLDLAKLRDALAQLAEGVEALHRGGRLHRDLKPANVLVFQADGRLVICDFGLVMDSTVRAKPVTRVAPPVSAGMESTSSRTEVAGTLAFMSPEQASGRMLSEASDWYAVGVMLYQALTLQVPFDPRLPWDQAVRAKNEQTPAHPLTIAPDVPSELAELAMSLLIANPESRAGYADVVAVLSGKEARADKRAELPELLIGRERELLQLVQAFERAKSGSATLAMISGMSGMGKSSVVRQVLLGATREGAIVLQGRCYECEDLPYKAVDPLMDALSGLLLSFEDPALVERLIPDDIGLLLRIFPVLSRVPAIAKKPVVEDLGDPIARRQRAAAVFKEVCRRLARERPLVLYVDDLQWGDLDSAAFFVELLRGPDAPSLLLLFAYRAEDESSELIRALRARYALETSASAQVGVKLEALSPADATKLSQALLAGSRAGADALQAIADEAQGSPFFIRELCSFLRTRGADHMGSLRLSTVIEDRISALPETARALLECVAVAGRRELTSVVDAASLLGAAAFGPAQVLKAHNLVQSSGTAAAMRIEASHDRIRETVYRALSEGRRRELHRMLAVSLEHVADRSAQPRDLEALLVHWRGAGESARALDYAQQAAKNAEQALAFGHAAKLYRQALELLSPAATQRSQLEESLGKALMFAGHGADAADAFLRAMDGATLEHSQELRRQALTQLLRAGQLKRAFAGLEEAEDVLGIRFPKSNLDTICMLLWRKARIKLDDRHLPAETGSLVSPDVTRQLDNLHRISVALSSVDFLRGGVYTAELTLRSLKARDPRQVALALTIEALRSAGSNDKPQRTAWVIERGEQLALRSGDRYVLAVSKGTTGVSRYLEGRFEEGIASIRESTRIHREELHAKDAWDIVIDLVFELRAHAQIGRVHEIVARVPEAIRDAESRGDIYAMAVLRLGRLCWAWLGLDQPELVREQVETAERIWVQAPYQLFHYYALQAMVELGLYQELPEAAFARLQREWKPMSFVRKIQFCRIEAHFMRGRLALQLAAKNGDKKLMALAEKDAHALAKESAAWAKALSGILRAGLLSFTSKDDAHALLVPLSAELTRLDMHLLAACARYRAAQLTGGAEGARALAECRDTITALGVRVPEKFVRMLAPVLVTR